MMLKQQEQIEQDKGKFLEFVEKYKGNIRQAGLAIDIKHPKQWIRYHSDKDPEFGKTLEELRDEIRSGLIQDAASLLYEKVFKEKDKGCIMFFLKCHGKEEGWSEYKIFEGSSSNVVINIIEEDTLDGKKARVRIEAAEDVSEAGGNIQ